MSLFASSSNTKNCIKSYNWHFLKSGDSKSECAAPWWDTGGEFKHRQIQWRGSNTLQMWSRMSLFLQHYVTLWEEMIRMEYSKLHPPLDEEENQCMECMKNQSNTILEELRKSEAMMVHKRSQLREMYQELNVISQTPYEVLQVSMEECLKQLYYLRPHLCLLHLRSLSTSPALIIGF